MASERTDVCTSPGRRRSDDQGGQPLVSQGGDAALGLGEAGGADLGQEGVEAQRQLSLLRLVAEDEVHEQCHRVAERGVSGTSNLVRMPGLAQRGGGHEGDGLVERPGEGQISSAVKLRTKPPATDRSALEMLSLDHRSPR